MSWSFDSSKRLYFAYDTIEVIVTMETVGTCITSNYQQIRYSDWPINLIVSGIVGGVNKQNRIVTTFSFNYGSENNRD